jgi:hypothetical protein
MGSTYDLPHGAVCPPTRDSDRALRSRDVAAVLREPEALVSGQPDEGTPEEHGGDEVTDPARTKGYPNAVLRSSMTAYSGRM